MIYFIPWVISSVALVLSVLGWGQDFGWHFYGFTLYEWFPLFGLIAFSLMWAHYAVDFVSRFGKFKFDESYLFATRYIVLFALLLHPGLLALQLWREGFGLPPMSWLSFIGPDLQWAIIVGLCAWLAFLLFELHRWFRGKSWFRWIVLANAGAMVAVVIHVLYVAEPLGWFRNLWYLYGISLIIFLIKELYDYRTSK